MGQFALSAKLAKLNSRINSGNGNEPALPSLPTYRPSRKHVKASQKTILSTLAKLNARLAQQMQAKLTAGQQGGNDSQMTPEMYAALQDAAANVPEAQAAPTGRRGNVCV